MAAAETGGQLNKEPLISVVVPVYNAENFLAGCVASIRAQTYRNLEILLVDDGSADGSLRLCRALAQEDERIRVFTESNGGAARARNTGIREAKGEYIGFVDSDDHILPEMYENLLRGARQMEADGYRRYIVQCGRREVDGKGKPLPDAVKAPEHEMVVTPTAFAESLLLYQGDASFCTAMIPASYMKAHLFTEGELGEDFALLMRMIPSLEALLRLPQCGYLVTHRRGSATRRANPSQFSKVYIDIVRHADEVEQEMVPQHPELAVAALRFGLYERLDYLLHVPIADMNRENTFYMDVVEYLRRNFRGMLRNPYLTKKNKAYLTLLTAAPKLTRQIHWKLRRKAILADQGQ